LFQSTPLEENAGFTLIEALVALSIVAVALSSIGALIASSARGARAIDAHLSRLQTMRSIITALPARDRLVPGTLSGVLADHRWRVDVVPFATQGIIPPPAAQWVPQTVIVRVAAPSGATMQISTVRLQRRTGN
jgi:general secretion pathway protein I